MNPRYVMLTGGTLIAGVTVLMTAARGTGPAPMQSSEFTASVVASGLDTPWDLVWGPDGMIWVSERGGRISRVDPANGRRTIAGELADVQEIGEGGLMGIALHPDFARDPWVYAVHTYRASGIQNRLVRLRWDGSALGRPQVLLDGIPGGGIHNGSRVIVGRDRMLYVTTGDAGSAQLAQDSTSLAGKVLRLDLDGGVPPSNPFGTAVWSWGHRNAQGLVEHPTMNIMYSTEHGAGDNDEINVIRRGGNYGWPTARGSCDDPGEMAFCRERGVEQPLLTWTPTVAISGADLYFGRDSSRSQAALLATSLGGRTLWRITFREDGRRVLGHSPILSGVYGRLRDVLVAPNGDIYIATSNRDGRGSPADGDDRIIKLIPRR